MGYVWVSVGLVGNCFLALRRLGLVCVLAGLVLTVCFFRLQDGCLADLFVYQSQFQALKIASGV